MSEKIKEMKDLHLALSLNDDCWPKLSEPLLFDSGSHGSALSLLKTDFQLAPSPWAADSALPVSPELIQKYYELLLQNIRDTFNELFKEEHSLHFYRVLLGPTLYWMLNVFYDRYHRIEIIYKNNPNIKFPITKNKITFLDTYGFVIAAKECEFYNAHIISYVTKNFNVKNNYDFSSDSDQNNLKKYNTCLYENATNKNVKHYAKSKLTKALSTFFKKPQNIHYKLSLNINLFRRLRYGISSLDDSDMLSPISMDTPLKSKNKTLRSALHHLMKKNNQPSHNNFLEVFLEFFAYEMPLSFIEYYSLYNSWAKQTQQKYSVKIISSLTGWYFDEPFKYFAAHSVEQGTKLVGFQHGGNYQILKEHFAFNHEKKITDFYFTLGKSDKAKKNCDVYHNEKFSRNHDGDSSSSKNILFVSTSPCKFLIEFPCTTEKSALYIKNQVALISKLEAKNIENLIYRPYHSDHVWNLTNAIKTLLPTLKIDSNPNFSLSLASAKLVICDNLSTTFLESLAKNKPTILCWPREMYCINEESEKFFNDLRDAKILHYCHKEAANTVQSILLTGIKRWWAAPERQACINIFLQHFVSINTNKNLQNKSSILKKFEQLDLGKKRT